jgi:hypothetical protein
VEKRTGFGKARSVQPGYAWDSVVSLDVTVVGRGRGTEN